MKRSEGFVQVDGAKLHYKEFGEGLPVILVHGGPGMDHTCFLPQFEELANNHRVVLYDQRACGQSTGLAEKSSITLKQFADDLEALRKSLSLDPVAVIGFSFGGLLAMKHAVTYPSSISRLVLMDSLPASETDAALFSPILRQRTPAAEQAEIEAIRASEGYLTGKGAVLNHYFRVRFRSYFYDENALQRLSLTFTDETGKNYASIVELMGDAISGWNLLGDLNKIKAPVLITNGDYDPIRPETMIPTIRALSQVTNRIIKGAGHFPYVEDADFIRKIILPFLSGHSDEASAIESLFGSSASVLGKNPF